MKRSLKLFLFSFFLSTLFFSCATTNFSAYSVYKSCSAPEALLCPENCSWQKIEDGVFESEFFIKELNVKWTCVKFDFSQKKPELCFSISQKSASDKEFTSFYLKDFSKKTNCPYAVNTTPFAIKNGREIPVGILKSEGKILSAPIQKYSALCFTKDEQNDYVWKIAKAQTEKDVEDAEWAFGGFFTILYENEILPYNFSRHSRTACGIADKGKTLFLFACTPLNDVLDNNGLSYEECAIILKKLGCSDAMEFDGGHSTGLIVNYQEKEKTFNQTKIPLALGIKF